MKGIKRDLDKAMKNVLEEMSFKSGKLAGAMASEGYAGGYYQALADVQHALDGVQPESRYWPKKNES